jgi:ABC-type phosphate transport system substrate-binding protein
MTSLSARRLIPACILSAATVAALVAPGVASATGKLGTQCSGSNITGQGSSLQKLAQQTVWNPDFNTSGNSHACNGNQGTKAKPTVTYTSTGSGTGLESWGANGHAAEFGASNAWISTDEPPNSTQISEIEAHGAPGTLETIPVLQGAVAIIVDLPEGCLGASKTNSGRLVFNNVTLQKIFVGEITKWSQITDNEDKLVAQKGKTCNPETTITPVVREDGSGTTHIFKKYLSLINSGSFETEKGETKNWTEISEGTENTTWPQAAHVVKPAAKGGGEEVAKVAATPSSIGYANLADARSNGSFSTPVGGGSKPRFWSEIQNDGIGTTGTITYAEPATNGDGVSTPGLANCAGEEYANGEEPFPPPSLTEPWNEVTTKTTEKKYTLCGLSYALSFTEYSKYTGTTIQEATTAENFLAFAVGSNTIKGEEGGQTLINENHDYLALPGGPVLTEAQKGAGLIRF